MRLVLHSNYWKCMIVYRKTFADFTLQMFFIFYAQISKIIAWNVLLVYDMVY